MRRISPWLLTAALAAALPALSAQASAPARGRAGVAASALPRLADSSATSAESTGQTDADGGGSDDGGGDDDGDGAQHQ